MLSKNHRLKWYERKFLNVLGHVYNVFSTWVRINLTTNASNKMEPDQTFIYKITIANHLLTSRDTCFILRVKSYRHNHISLSNWSVFEIGFSIDL